MECKEKCRAGQGSAKLDDSVKELLNFPKGFFLLTLISYEKYSELLPGYKTIEEAIVVRDKGQQKTLRKI